VEAIDLSGLSKLEAFVAPNNQLAGITWTKTSAANLYAALAYFDVSNNALNYTHFPTIDIAAHPINAVLAPQSAFAFSEGVDINTKVSFRDFRLNGWNQSITPVIKCYDAEGTELIEGTDYSIQSANLTILTPHEGMYIGISSNKYPSVELFSLPFDAKDPTGISTMNNAQSTMHNEVYDMQGRKVTNLDSRTSNPNLTKGIYIINGKKAVIK
ncbi:MAG: hypothetical protein IJS97_07120, partial [Prevotella sp.]|nr:hypothetical protein [Prevotella sp.]